MTLSGNLFFAVWGVLMAAHLGMLIRYGQMWAAHKAMTADRIRKHNARRGYGQSVSKEALAEAYTIPLKTDALSEFAQHNGMTATDYREELREQVGGSALPLLAVCYQVGTTLFGVSGLAYLATFGPMSREIYLLLLGGTLVLSIILYVVA